MVLTVSSFLPYHQNTALSEVETSPEQCLGFLLFMQNNEGRLFSSCSSKDFSCISPQAINMHMEVKLLIWENDQEISRVVQNTNVWLQGPKTQGHNVYATWPVLLHG